MDKELLELVVKCIDPVVESQKLKRQDGDDIVFVGKDKAVKIWYDADAKLCKLDIAKLAPDEAAEFETIDSWLFDEAHNERDAKSIGNDFLDTLNGVFGIKKVSAGNRSVALPTKAAPGSVPGVSAFCNRFLTLYPQYKDTYKEHMEKYGDFLYEHFFSQTAAEKLLELVNSGSKKNISKMLAMLDEFYVDGDYTVQSIITYTIIGGAFSADHKLFESIEEIFKDSAPHLLMPSRMMLENIARKEGKKQ